MFEHNFGCGPAVCCKRRQNQGVALPPSATMTNVKITHHGKPLMSSPDFPEHWRKPGPDGFEWDKLPTNAEKARYWQGESVQALKAGWPELADEAYGHWKYYEHIAKADRKNRGQTRKAALKKPDEPEVPQPVEAKDDRPSPHEPQEKAQDAAASLAKRKHFEQKA